jgi:acyl-CoA thioester hydrolase
VDAVTITLPITVIAFETDYGGVVSNTRYLEYIERGRYALLHHAGIKIEEFWKEHGVQPVVRHVEIEYLAPARHEDELELEVSVAAHGKTSTTLKYELRRGDVLLLRATQTLAYINMRWRPSRVPPLFLERWPVAESG